MQWIIPALAGIGVFMTLFGALSGTSGVVVRLAAYRRQSSLQARLQRLAGASAVQDAAPPSERVLYGTDRVPWAAWQAGMAVAGVALAWPLLRAPLALVGALLGLIPILARRYVERRGRMRLHMQIRAFVDELGLRPLDAGLGPALAAIAEDRHSQGILYDRLRLRVRQQRLGGEPLDTLKALASDVRSEELADLVRALDAARRGGESVSEALAASARELGAEMQARARAQVENAVNGLLVTAMTTLLTPVIVLSLYSLARFIVDALMGIGSGRAPGF